MRSCNKLRRRRTQRRCNPTQSSTRRACATAACYKVTWCQSLGQKSQFAFDRTRRCHAPKLLCQRGCDLSTKEHDALFYNQHGPSSFLDSSSAQPHRWWRVGSRAPQYNSCCCTGSMYCHTDVFGDHLPENWQQQLYASKHLAHQ